MKSILTLIILIIIFNACSDREDYNDPNGPGISGLFTELSGKVSGELSKSDSPYKITDDLIVDSGKTLIVNAGVELFFTIDTKLIVHGELIIDGSYYDMIKLESYDSTKTWQGIQLINTDKRAFIDYTYIKGIRKEYDSLYIPSSISITNSGLTIKHSVIYKNSATHGGAVGIFNGELLMTNNLIRDNDADFFGGALISEASDIRLINNTFYNNYSYNGVGGVLIYSPLTTELQNNIFYKNTSRTGQPHYHYQSEDSTNYIEQYNYFAFDQMDPIFFDEFYLNLYYTSPCKDAGNPDQSFNDFNGTRNDQGAYGGPEGNWY